MLEELQPKPGKDDYDQVKAFRPITLASFLFKALERVVQWEIEENILSKNPLSCNQHAFRHGVSTQTALSSLCNDIESAIYRDEIALGVFLDIKKVNLVMCLLQVNCLRESIFFSFRNLIYTRVVLLVCQEGIKHFSKKRIQGQ